MQCKFTRCSESKQSLGAKSGLWPKLCWEWKGISQARLEHHSWITSLGCVLLRQWQTLTIARYVSNKAYIAALHCFSVCLIFTFTSHNANYDQFRQITTHIILKLQRVLSDLQKYNFLIQFHQVVCLSAFHHTLHTGENNCILYHTHTYVWPQYPIPLTINTNITRQPYLEIWQSSNSTTFERFRSIWNSTNVLSVLLSNANSWKNPCSTDSQRAQINFYFSNSTYHTNYSYWTCNIIFAQWRVTLYYEQWFHRVQEITLLHHHLIDLNQCITFRLIK